MKPVIILVHETVWQSWAKDFGTLAMIVSLIGIGIFLNSRALQFVGAIMAMIVIVYLSIGEGKRMTIDEARAYLTQIEQGKN